ncbi:MAG: hypothetical protein JO046_06010 [Solirubrobacterales bacterium]|nr:hypothetical protein [Solirubrobacterales bacterium]
MPVRIVTERAQPRLQAPYQVRRRSHHAVGDTLAALKGELDVSSRFLENVHHKGSF